MPTSPLRVLVIPSDDATRDLIAEELRHSGGDRGMRVQLVDSFDQARTHLLDDVVDCVLLGLGVADGAGLGSIGHVLRLDPGAAVVVVLDDPSDAVVRQAITAGAQEVLSTAELSPAALRRTVEVAVLRHRRWRRALQETRRLLAPTSLAVPLVRDRQPVWLSEVVQLGCAVLAEEIEQAGAVVATEDLPTVWGSAPQLRQVFLHLLRNAIRHRHPDRPPEVEISAATRAHQVVVAIDDNGPGIPPVHRHLVFLPGYQVPEGRTAGPGLGLATSRAIVEHLDGTIWIGESPTGGTRVELTLPRDASLQGADPHTS